jgi:hypothetical protein
MPESIAFSAGLSRGTAAGVFAFVAAGCAVLLLTVVGRPLREPVLTLGFVAVVAGSSALAALALWRVRATVWSGLAIGAAVPLLALLALALVVAATPLCSFGGYFECVAKAGVLFGVFAGVPVVVIGMCTGGALGAWAARRGARRGAGPISGTRK